MEGSIKSVRFVLLLAACSLGARPTTAGPIDFLKRVGASIGHPHRPQPVHRSTRKKTDKREGSSGSDQTAVDPPANPSPAATITAPATLVSPTASSTPETVRTASSVPPKNFSRTDLPYGVPVPNKPGFVTSPYSPGGGYVDVRGYPSGIEVKDPYTGRVFRTP